MNLNSFFCHSEYYVFSIPLSITPICSQLHFLPITKMLYLDYNHHNGLLLLTSSVVLAVWEKKKTSICSANFITNLSLQTPFFLGRRGKGGRGGNCCITPQTSSAVPINRRAESLASAAAALLPQRSKCCSAHLLCWEERADSAANPATPQAKRTRKKCLLLVIKIQF